MFGCTTLVSRDVRETTAEQTISRAVYFEQGNILNISGTAAANTADLDRRMRLYYQGNRYSSRFTHIYGVTMFCSNVKTPNASFPKLKGKAAQTRAFGPALLHMFEQVTDPSVETNKKVRLALKLSCRAEDILREHKGSFKLPTDAANDLEKTVDNFCLLYGNLAHEFQGRGIRLFNVTIKAHQLVHASRHSRHANPSFTWCYAGEDFMRHCRQLSASCLRGTKGYLLAAKFLDKYIAGMFLRMSDRASWIAR